MPASRGSGQPLHLRCWMLRHTVAPLQDPAEHRLSRTGRTRKFNPIHGNIRGVRMLDTEHEYQCTCGHKGWTRHRDVLTLAETSRYGR